MNCAIIIATYGDECWEKLALERALPTALGQGAYDVLRAHHRKGPIALARNLLAGETDADWLCFLDADDELAPGYLDAMARAFEQEGGDSITTAFLLTPAVSYVRRRGQGKRGPRTFQGDTPRFLDRGIPLTDDNWLVVGTLIHRDLFWQVDGFSDYEHGFEDFSLWSKAWRSGARIVKVPDAVYYAYVNPQSKHRQGWRNRSWQVAYHQRVIQELNEWEAAQASV